MIDFEERVKSHQYIGVQTKEKGIADIFKLVYGWMFLGLALSGAVAYYFFSSGAYQYVNPIIFLIIELVLVIVLSFCFRKLSFIAALLLFLVYAALNGATLSVIFLVYQISTIQNANLEGLFRRISDMFFSCSSRKAPRRRRASFLSLRASFSGSK